MVKKESTRQLRVAKEIKQIISKLFTYDKIHEVLVGNILCTISKVTVSPDLKLSSIYLTFDQNLESSTIENIIKILNQNFYVFTKPVANLLKTRYTPKIKFFSDFTLDQAYKVSNLLNNIELNDIESNDDMKN